MGRWLPSKVGAWPSERLCAVLFRASLAVLSLAAGSEIGREEVVSVGMGVSPEGKSWSVGEKGNAVSCSV